ncbi:hypothetical protein E8E01_15125 [Methylorubrum populi]|uniref:hypothetical protein n=1 Tax=Methylorubrum populi TaxID=223967 RepID=UPI00114D9997|nr:hypothetical protein [Methylorubrum populi]QDI81680.1 hypothetical protein E8E01_15125 [Methylorubrum populi]
MGTQIVAKGADFSAISFGFAAPVTRGLEYWNYFGDSADKTGRNLVVGKSGVAVVGAPVVNPGYARMTAQSAYVQTAVLDQAAVTFLAVCRPADLGTTQWRYPIASIAGGTGAAVGASLAIGTDNAPKVYASRNNGTSDVALVTGVAALASATPFGFYAGRVGPAYNRIDDKTRSVSNAGAVTNPRSTPNGQAYRVGSGIYNTGSQLGVLDISFAAIFSVELTDAEIDAVYQRVKAFEAARGKTI